MSPSAPPVVFDTPTLGRAVRLGELYDVRSVKFLGVQLYPQDNVKEVETGVGHTELTVSLSTTHQQKATVLDINAQLSLDVLGGLVKVSGSASYLNDEKSNTNEYAYALALKMRLKEKRILFAENDLGYNILPLVAKDYINTKRATHFVSSIVHGGNYIVNLVARQAEMSKEEKIELQASFNKLKGAISLKGSVEANIKEQFSDMDHKFDLVVHGDVALGKVPSNPKDVLDTFPEAASVIIDGGGVPISVTLQPISPDLLIYQIEEMITNTILASFSNLDDIRSRFLVLQDSAERQRDFVPTLAAAIRNATAMYIQDHGELLQELAMFLQDCKLGKNPDHHALLRKVGDLYKKHLKPGAKDPEMLSHYPSSLVGLEDELSRFQYLVTDIRRVRDSLNPPKSVNPGRPGDVNKQDDCVLKHSFYLSTIEDVCRAIRTQNETILFIMTPISGDSKHDLLVLEYLAIVREYAAYFEDYQAAHMFYAENLEDLKRRVADDKLSDGKKFPELAAPAVVAARVDKKGKLTWDASPPILPPSSPVHTFALIHTPKEGQVGSFALGIEGVNSKKAFSFHIRAKERDLTGSRSWIILLEDWDSNRFLSFHKGFWVQLDYLKTHRIQSKANKRPDPGKEFMGTFVQDIQNHQWILYLDGDEIAREAFTEKDLFPYGEKIRISYYGGGWWDGQLLEFKAFARALSQEEVKGLYSAWKNGQN